REQNLDDAQRAKITSIRKVLYSDAAKLEARLGLINQKDWERRFGGTCLFYGLQPYHSYTNLTSDQADRFEQLQRERNNPIWAEIRAKSTQREALLNSGATKDSPAAVELGQALNKLSAQL